MQRQPMAGDWLWRMLIGSVLTDLWLATGDLARAQPAAEMSVKLASAAGERTLRALSFEARIRLALAEEKLDCARDSLKQAHALGRQ